MIEVLDRRALNRATLVRQGLTQRVPRTDAVVLETVRHLAGLQGQDPEPPYVMLWDRIEGFEPADLQDRLDDRSLVRAALYRSTQHLLPAEDHRWVQPLLQPMLERQHRSAWKAEREGVDLDELVATTHAALAGRTIPRPELQQVLVARWPDRDPLALARLVQGHLPIVHPPPDGYWRRHGPSQLALAEDWIGPPDEVPEDEAAERIALRYLAAFGPASVKDLQAWSGMTRQKATLERLRPELAVFEDEKGVELFDLPDCAPPDGERPRPAGPLPRPARQPHPRLRRPHPGGARAPAPPGRVGGHLPRRRRGAWLLEGGQGRRPPGARGRGRLAPQHAQQDEVEDEGMRLLAFLEPDAEHDVRLWATGDPR